MDELTALANAARRGEPQMMAAFIRESQRPVWSFCAHMVDGQSADDLTQETLLRAFRSLPSFRQDSSARTWLLSIARRVCADELRSRTHLRRRDARLSGLRHEEETADIAEQAATRDLLNHLDTERRAAFVLTQLFGMSYAEAAATCHCPVGTVRSRVARARSDLIRALNTRSSFTEEEPGGGVPRGRCGTC